MEQRVTWDWLRKFANQYKHASYQDKLHLIFREKNPFYLLEWLVFPLSGAEREQIDSPRSPGMRKNSTLAFAEVFAHQLLYDVCFSGWGADEEMRRLLMAAAIRDLRRHYGGEVWDEGVRKLAGVWRESAEQYGQFQTELEKQLERLRRLYEGECRDIAVQHQNDVGEKQQHLDIARAKYEAKRENARRQLLRQYGEWPLVGYMFFREWNEARSRIDRFLEMMQSAPDAAGFLAYPEKHDFDAFYREIILNEEQRRRFLPWFAAYASAAGLIRGSIDTTDRQMWWARFLAYASRIEAAGDRDDAEQRNAPLREAAAVTFDIDGFEHRIVTDDVPDYFPLLVQAALGNERRRKWLEEKVILRYWPLFMRQFMREDCDFRRLSWVLCLDPVSLEQRLLRRNPHAAEPSPAMEPAAVVERISRIFTDGIRAGNGAERLTPVFQYLAAHNPDALYAFIFNMNDSSGLIPLLDMKDRHLQRLFGHEGVRSAAVRNHVRPLFLAWLRKSKPKSPGRSRLVKLGRLLAPDKKELLLDWLSGVSLEPGAWPRGEAELLAEIFQIEWLGDPTSAPRHHDMVEGWLDEHSDVIRFEHDTPNPAAKAARYRIVRPGIRDALTGQILARAIVRAEYAEPQKISDLLDELKQL
jgi:hypothetical protein